jgi:hypothetical protein
MESRGWIYWRKKRASSGTLSSAALSVQQLLEPGKRHVLEMKQERRERREESYAGEK